MRVSPQLAEEPLVAPTRGLAYRHALALLAVAVLAIVGQVIVQRALRYDAARARLLGLAGEQRLLGERLGRTALQLGPSHDPEARAELRRRLAATVDRLRAADDERRALSAALADVDDVVAPAADLEAVDEAARALLREETSGAATTARVDALLAHQARLADALAVLVARHEEGARASAAALATTERTILAGLLAVLLLEGLFVFRPALRRLQRAIEASVRGGQEKAALLEAIPEPVVLLTRDGRLGDAAAPASDPAVAHLQAFLAGPHAARAHAAIREALAGDTGRALDVGADIDDRRFELRLSRYNDAAVLGILHDVTGQRRLERRMLDEIAGAQKRMGSELHDGLCQQLTGLLLLAQALEGAARRGEPLALADVALLREHLSACAVEARQVAGSLYPVVLSRHGLADALRQLCDTTAALHRVRCTCTADASGLDLEGTAIHLYRIAQEAVANAVRHARCAAIDVSLVRTDDALTLTIDDDGVGFAGRPRDGGIGLHSMHFRAEAIGAWLTIGPRDGGGTRVRCVLPQAPAAKEATA